MNEAFTSLRTRPEFSSEDDPPILPQESAPSQRTREDYRRGVEEVERSRGAKADKARMSTSTFISHYQSTAWTLSGAGLLLFQYWLQQPDVELKILDLFIFWKLPVTLFTQSSLSQAVQDNN